MALVVLALLFAYAPSVFGSSNGMNSENPAWPTDFNESGCTSCHGEHSFAATENKVSWTLTDAEGNDLTGSVYEHDAVYTFTITLMDEINPEAANHAGFYMSASEGKFEAAEGSGVQVTGGDKEVSHTDATQTSWTFTWTAPAEGAIAFQLLVNDVDGSFSPDEGDNVYRSFFALTDDHGAQLGAAPEEHEQHYGLALPQYWLGLVALASMILVIMFSFVYLKFVNPHNTDQKDR